MEKYKRCCRGKTNWEAILDQGPRANYPHLCLRGKNLVFLAKLLEVLQLTPGKPIKE